MTTCAKKCATYSRSAPLQIALCCYFIYKELGPAVFSGVAIMVLTIPINMFVGKFSRNYQLKQVL